MIISCDKCNSSFSIVDNLIKATGSKVRCSRCNNVFMAYPKPPESNVAMESEEMLLVSDEEIGLEDIDSSVDDYSRENESLEAEVSSEAAADELELDLDFNSDDDAAPDTTGEAIVDDELPDLGDFEDLAGLDDESLTMDGDQTEDELDDLDLELETGPKAGKKPDEADFEPEDGEQLDIADLEIEDDDIPALEAPSALDPEDLDLGLDLDLEGDAHDGEEIAETGLEVEETDELDLSDLGLEMEDAALLDEASAGGADELKLDLDQEADTIAGDEEIGTDELDLSDLEDTIESDEAGESTEDTTEEFEPDLDFQVDEDAQTADSGVDAEDDDELDFSDIEQMLESDEEAPVEAAAGEDDEELELQFDIEEQPASGADLQTDDDVGEAVQEDDLLDIEQMLEQGEDTAPQEAAETTDEELPLEMEAALDDASKGAEPDMELDFDLESELQEKEVLFDSGASADEKLESNLLITDEVEFLDDTGIEEAELQDATGHVGDASDEFATDEFTDTRDAYGQTDVLPVTEDELQEEPAETATEARSRSKKPVLVIVLLLLLAVGILIVPNMLGIKIPYISDIKIPYLSDLNLEIPYLSNLLNPEEQDINGNLKMTPLAKTITSMFITNSKAGRLLVIRGKIKNEYDQPRSFVKVTGKLYQKGNKLTKTATVYCGNVLSDPQLAGMDIGAINKKMENKFGDKRSNLKIKTGKMVPFMIVFDKLPRNLDEYTVEVAESSI